MSKTIRSLVTSPYVCSQCLSRSSRRFSTSPRLRNGSAPSPPASSGFTELTHRGLVHLSGKDAAKFLQGLTTNNVDSSRETPWYSGFLSAQGRVLWDALVYPYLADGQGERSYLIEVDREEVDSFMKHLKRHKLRSKVAVRDVREEWRVWSAWLDGESLGASSSRTEAGKLYTVDPRLPNLGHRVLLGADEGTPSHTFSHYETLGEAPLESYTTRRYLHGIAEGQKEILRESALPMESNMDYLNGIDFRKGCYVGQELTIRTQHTGVIRKRILPVQLYSSEPPSELSYEPASFQLKTGTDIKAEGGRRPAGKFLANVGNVGLALCRLENMTDMKVSAEGGTWKEGMEFNIATEDGDKVKVKAFVPKWLLAREQEKMERRARREDSNVD